MAAEVVDFLNYKNSPTREIKSSYKELKKDILTDRCDTAEEYEIKAWMKNWFKEMDKLVSELN